MALVSGWDGASVLLVHKGEYGSKIGWNGDDWTSENQHFRAEITGNETDLYWQVIFTFDGFDPNRSQFSYGKTTVLSNQAEEIPGHAYLLDNTANDTPLDFSHKEVVTEHQARSTSTSQTIHMDVGTKTGVTVGGDDTGAKFEQEVSTAWGISTDKSTAEEESKDKTEEVDLSNTVEPRRALLATVSTANIKSQTPFDVDGIWTGEIHLEFWIGGWVNPSNNQCGRDFFNSHRVDQGGQDVTGHRLVKASWSTWDDFEDLMNGVNTDWPHFKHIWSYPPPGEVAGGIVHMTHPTSRSIKMSGIQHREYQDGTDAKFVDVTGQDPNDVIRKHGIDKDHICDGTDQDNCGTDGGLNTNITDPGVCTPQQMLVIDEQIFILCQNEVRQYSPIGEILESFPIS